MAGPIPTKTIPQLTDYGAPFNGAELVEIWSADTSRRTSVRSFVLPMDGLLTFTGQATDLPGSRQLIGSSSIQLIDAGPGQIQLIATLSQVLPTGAQTLAPAPGAVDNLVINADTGFLDIDTNSGNVDLTGVVPARDGQFLTISNIGVNILNLLALDSGSSPGRRFRLSDSMSFLRYGGITVRYSVALGVWVPV